MSRTRALVSAGFIACTALSLLRPDLHPVVTVLGLAINLICVWSPAR